MPRKGPLSTTRTMPSVIILVVVAGALRVACGLPLDNDFNSIIFMPGDIPLMFDIGAGSNGGGSTGRTSSRGNPPASSHQNIGPPITNETTETVVKGVNCGPKYGSAVYNGTCQRLLTQSSCLQGEWLVRKKDSNEGECVARSCPKGQLYFEKKCVNISDRTLCSRGQMLYVDLTGSVHCDCEPNYFFDPFQGQCFAQQERGSCGFGQYLEVTNSGRVACVTNPCQMDGFLQNNVNGRCYRKRYMGTCAHPFSMNFSDEKMTVHCIAKSPHTIFDLPSLKACPPGSLRDFSGVCREGFRVAAENIYPSSFGTCMNGFVMDPMGNCRKVNKLFR